ncbi:hypothetical protein AB990_13140 [Alkalihalobacillus pseudalcaliphilus]|nr:hypothetical protein AB990_13140 [Alkalihalobacillus pseudalcaliphilus]
MVLRNLTNETLSQSIVEDHNSLGWLSWHLVVSISSLGQLAGISFSSVKQQADNPNDAEQILATYQQVTKDVNHFVDSNWTDQNLAKEIDMYGEAMTVGRLLQLVLLHQTHHRGQMTVLMRQAGLKVPGLFGPTKEDLEAYK